MTITVYAIGDVQGCCTNLKDLLRALPNQDQAQLWFAGDLVNRGPESLQALRSIKALGDRAVCVLGNHDLHLLAVAAGVRKANRHDTISAILAAPDCDELITWLRHRPLAWYQNSYLLVHAGIHPQWTVEQTINNARQVELALQSPDWKAFLSDMYGNTPDSWSESLQGSERLRTIVNVLTRMRMLDTALKLDLQFKKAPDQAPTGLLPWYCLPAQRAPDVTVIFGHWSTLGLMVTDQTISLDSGCVWGGKLSAVRLQDRAVFQVQCQAPTAPAID